MSLTKVELKCTKINHSEQVIYISMGYTEYRHILLCLMAEFEKENHLCARVIYIVQEATQLFGVFISKGSGCLWNQK